MSGQVKYATTCLSLALAAMLTAACGGKGGGNGGLPTAPGPPSAQPAAVNVTGHWDGHESHAQGSGSFTLDLTQTGTQVSGNLSGFGKAGPFVGTVAGNRLSFNFSYGNGGNGCGNAISGTATIGPDLFSGTFSGQDCNGQAVTNGTLALLLNVPLRTSAPITGTWESIGTLQPSLGGGTWTWVLSQSTGDVYSGEITGSVELSNNTLGLSSGSVSGTVNSTFPGPMSTASFSVNLSGRCPVNLTITNANVTIQANAAVSIGGGTLSGTTCNGTFVPSGGFGLAKVSDSTTLPPPSPPSLNLSGDWAGPSTDSFESGTITAQLTQNGGYVAGGLMLSRNDNVTKGGNIQASLNSSTLTFTLNIGPQGGCPTTVTGTAQATNTSIDGTYSGTSCQGDVSNGHLTLSRQ